MSATYLTLDGQPPRTETDAEVVATLVRKGWQVSEPPVVEDMPPTFTAEGWLESQGYGGARSTTLLYLKLQLQSAGKTSTKLAAAQAWLDGIIAVGAADPDAQHAGLPAAPFGFAEVCQEALATLQGGQ